jgi:hypothetical protein
MIQRTLSEQDMVDILEEIAKDGGNAAARIAAIKTLRELDRGEPSVSTFEGLYEVGKPAKTRAG